MKSDYRNEGEKYPMHFQLLIYILYVETMESVGVKFSALKRQIVKHVQKYEGMDTKRHDSGPVLHISQTTSALS